MAEILQKFCWFFWEIWRQQNSFLRLNDLQWKATTWEKKLLSNGQSSSKLFERRYHKETSWHGNILKPVLQVANAKQMLIKVALLYKDDKPFILFISNLHYII